MRIDQVDRLRKAANEYCEKAGWGAVNTLVAETGCTRQNLAKFRRGSVLGEPFATNLALYLAKCGMIPFSDPMLHGIDTNLTAVYFPGEHEMFDLMKRLSRIEEGKEMLVSLSEISDKIRGVLNESETILNQYRNIKAWVADNERS